MAHCGIKFQQGVHNKLANICENCAQFCQLVPQTPQPPHYTHTHTYANEPRASAATSSASLATCLSARCRQRVSCNSNAATCLTVEHVRCKCSEFTLCDGKAIGNIAISVGGCQKLINKSHKNNNENEKITSFYFL